AEAGEHDLLFVSLAIAVGVLHEEDVRGIGHPNASTTDRDAGWNIQTLREDRELVGRAITVGIFENLHAIAAGTGGAARILETLGDPEAAPFVERHGHRIDD